MRRTFKDAGGFSRRVQLEKVYAGTPVFRPLVETTREPNGHFLWWTTYNTVEIESTEWVLVDFIIAGSVGNRVLGTRTMARGTDTDQSPARLYAYGDGSAAAKFADKPGENYWLYRGQVFRSRGIATFFDIKKMIDPHADPVLDGSDDRREPIPDRVKTAVWRRDEGRCVTCGSQARLEFDHIIPVVRGGSNTARNLQLLCESCNRSKGGNLV